MLDASARLVVESAKREAADLRALLRYLYLRGALDVDLGTAMPPVATCADSARADNVCHGRGPAPRQLRSLQQDWPP